MSISAITSTPVVVRWAPEAKPAEHVCYVIPPHITKKLYDAGHHHCELDHMHRDARKNLAMHHDFTIWSGYNQPQVISVYDSHHREQARGTLLTTNKPYPANKDLEAGEAYDGAKNTYDFYSNILGRKSVDNKNYGLKSFVHYGVGYNNAFWDGQEMVYGDGDGKVFDRFTKSIDVIGHELTHGVTQYTANFIYQDQPGALNESMSDCMGSTIKQYVNKQTAAQADWLIGQGLLKTGESLRSMKAPGTAYNNSLLGKDPQPAKMSGYVHTTDDEGGVHINSGIPNHAFYLFATQLGGNTWDKAAKVWYASLQHSKSKDQFKDFANATINQTLTQFKAGSAEETAIRSAWKTTEVLL